MARPESGRRVIGWAAAATLLAAAPLLAACSGDSHSRPSSASHDSSGPSPSTPTSDESGASSDGGSGAQADDQSTVSSAVGAWVDAVIQKDAKRVCLLSSVSGNGSAPPTAATPQMCSAATTQRMAVGLEAMSKAFTPRNASGRPRVKVNVPTPQGNEAVVPAAKVMIDGQSLRAILLSHSHNVDPKTFTFKAKANKINGKWYVGNNDVNSGDQTLKPQTLS